MTPESLCGHKEPGKETYRLYEFVKEVMSYKFEDEPNYNKLKFLLTKALIDYGTMPSKDYDWISMVLNNESDLSNNINKNLEGQVSVNNGDVGHDNSSQSDNGNQIIQ